MTINNQIKEHVVKKNIYDVSSMLALLGTLIALCSCMLKMYIVYKMDGYLGYNDADKELIGLNDSFSLYAISVLAFGTVLFLFYSLIFNRLWKNYRPHWCLTPMWSTSRQLKKNLSGF